MKNIKNFDGFVKESEQVKKDAKKKRAKKDDKGKDTAVMQRLATSRWRRQFCQ